MFKKRQDAIGILGGTFDPIHFGHLRLALEIQQDIKLDHVRLMPCYLPVHRPPPVASAEHRLTMIQMAIEPEASLQVDVRELHRTEPSYAIDTIKSLKSDFGETPISLIMGNDAFMQFNQWKDWEDFLNHCHIVVAHRPSFNIPMHSPLHEKLNANYTQNKEDLLTQECGKIYFQKITSLDISATDIREQYQEGYNTRFLLPESVCHYINEHELYRG